MFVMLVVGPTAKSNERAPGGTQTGTDGSEGPARGRKPLKATQLGFSKFIVIGKLGEQHSHRLFLQDFKINGESFIPLFSSDQEFHRQTAGSGFEGDGIEIDCGLLVSLLRGDELLVLDSGDPEPVRLKREDLM